MALLFVHGKCQHYYESGHSSRVEDPAKRFIDGLGGGEGGRNFGFKQNQVASFAEPGDVFATNATFHRRKVVLGSEVIVRSSSCLAHRMLVRASSLVGR